MGSSALSLTLLLMSLILAGLTQDLPRPTLTVTPDSPVFTGETVILKCVINSDHSDWRYVWYKDHTEVSERHTVNRNTLTIERSKTSDAGQYTCRGHIDRRSVSSQSSFAVYLSVKALPTPTLTVTPDSPVFTGERVSLTCVINSDHSDWRYEWNKGSTKVSERHTVNRNTLTIERSETSDAGLYTCRGHIDGRSVSSQSSSAVSLSVKDSPRSTLTVTPNSPVFTGERVHLKCVIESHSDWRWRNGLKYDRRYDWTNYQTYEWRYEWYKGSVMLQTSEHYTVYRDTLTIRGATESDQDQFWCRGQRDERPNSSQLSSAVYLSVKDLPRSTLTVTPDSPVFTGERVDLKCVIESYSNWRYEWYKGRDSVMLQTSERYTVNRDTLTIRGATESDAGQFWCRGQRDGRPKSSQSSSVSLTVKDLPTSTLTVTPNSVFTGERVSLTCVIESYSNWRQRNGLTYDRRRYDWTYYQTYEWRYEWYKGSVMLQTSERYTVYRDTLTIRRATESDQDQFWCRGQRDERPNSSKSSSVYLRVKDLPTSTLTVTPDSPVFTGETVNLTCVINSNHSDWRYEWYKGGNNSVMLQTSERYTVNRDTLTIRGVNESDQDQFWCRGQRDERPNSSQESERINLSVNGNRNWEVQIWA
uniref:Ig-like domain-containing protein n=1 Tax=Cyprinus carpio TaxID=7962 RepID=A0A8C1SQ18_CYPCA